MALPKVAKQNIYDALKYIDEHGSIPSEHASTRYLLLENGKEYAPKYVIAVANHLANGVEIVTNFGAVEAKNYLIKMGFTIKDMQEDKAMQKKYELTITADSVVSTDTRFTMDNLGLGNNYKPVDAYFIKEDGTIVSRNYEKGERKNSNQTMPRIACQVYEKQLAELSFDAKNDFPVCRYRLSDKPICGIYPSVDEFKEKNRNTLEFLTYTCKDGQNFVIYCWNIFSTIIFVQECLKRFGEEGDKFVLVYCDKSEKEETIVDTDEQNSKFEKCDKPYNRIIYGAPGTGKSFNLNEDVKKCFVKENIFRVTFHPDYSYANFVGTYKPSVKETGEIEYKYVPGPFMLAYVKAQNSDKPVVLVIEEINRANTAAVFGDIFQLLDRKTKSDKEEEIGTSEYPIVASMDIQSYLKKELEKEITELTLPSNLYLWATMNSADQGVFPMDTAFKRRWSFEYTEVDKNAKSAIVTIKGQEEDWNLIRKAINDVLADKLKVNEDKLMGAYFLKESELKVETFSDAFKYKVLMYLYDDAARQKRSQLFASDNVSRFSKLCDEFDKQGLKIFCADFFTNYDKYKKPNSENS